MLCEKCSAIPFHNLESTRDTRHHGTFAELDQSAQNGCKLCHLFRKVTLEYYANFVFQSIEKAEAFHRSLDESAGKIEQLDDITMAEQYDNESRGNSEDSEEDTTTAFFVEAVALDIDSDFAPLERGLQRLLYIRRPDIEDEQEHEWAVPLKEVYPILNIACSPGMYGLTDILVVLTLADSVALHKWNIIGRPISTPAEIPLAREWLHDCLENHNDCSYQSKTQLPTRVLDLVIPNEVKLIVDSQDTQPYATLSHCWGKSQPLRLTSATYDIFQRGILCDSLPKTFQDAVTVSRTLGIRYLWIDSMCILQDSKRDWEEQCVKMSKIYSDSIVTIAGPAAVGSESGFLHPREPPCHLTIMASDGEASSEIFISHDIIDEDAYNLAPEPNSPLAERGWVLQERLLSRRVLYIGSRNMYLECSKNVRFDICHYPILWDYQDVSMVTKPFIKQLSSSPESF